MVKRYLRIYKVKTFNLEGSVPCFLKLEDEGKQLTVGSYLAVNNSEACAEHCFNLSRPGFVYGDSGDSRCALLKSQSTGELNERNGYYTNSKLFRYAF